MPGQLIAAWSFDASPCVDHTGNGYDFTPSGNTVVAAGGAHGSALTQVTASETFTAFALPPAFETPHRTWMANVKYSGSGTDIGWLGEFYRSTSDTGVWGLLMLNGSLQFRMKDSSNVAHVVGLSTPTTFKNIAGTYDGSNLRVYTDGVLAGSVASPAPWSATHFRPFDYTSGGVTTWLDDLRLFDDALTDTEIQAWMNLPADQMPAQGGRLKYESAPGVWTPVPLKLATGEPLIVKSETSPGTWEALP